MFPQTIQRENLLCPPPRAAVLRLPWEQHRAQEDAVATAKAWPRKADHLLQQPLWERCGCKGSSVLLRKLRWLQLELRSVRVIMFGTVPLAALWMQGEQQKVVVAARAQASKADHLLHSPSGSAVAVEGAAYSSGSR